jgi:transposase
MPNQNIIEQETSQREAILVPLGLAEWRILKQESQTDGKILVEVMSRENGASCPHCGQMSTKHHDTRKRKKKDVPLRDYEIELIVHKRRYWCARCSKAFTEKDRACGWRRRTTVRLREEIGRRACTQPVAHVAAHYHVGPRFVEGCLQAVAAVHLQKKGLSLDEEQCVPTPRFLGIDEFARRKGHRYDTILCDLEARHVLEVSAGRKLEDVGKLLARLDNPDVVEAVSMDMSASFRPAVQRSLPKAQIVVDHFHVIQHVMKAFKKVVHHCTKEPRGKILLEGNRHLFVRNAEDLTAQQEQARLWIAARLPILATAWQLKEALRTWYATATVETAPAGLDRWISQVQKHGPAPLRKALSAFVNWRHEILAFFQFLPTRLSNGFVEGKNNRTKALMRQAYGYRNRSHLRLRILLGVTL